MIIPNGFIRFLQKTEEVTFDSKGYPLEKPETAGCPIPCQFYANGQNLQAKSEGEPITRVSYVILIDNRYKRGKRTERLQLFNSFGEPIGVFSTKSIEPLDAVCQTRLTV